MNWPTAQDFNEAVQNAATAFADPDLKAGEAVAGPTGLPMPRSGNFADVYQIRTPSGKDWAVKCFTRYVPGLDDRYRKISAALGRAGLPFAVGFTYLEQGVRVRGEWRPVLKMEWVEGLQLNQFVRDYAGKPDRLDKLSALWVKLSRRLREAGIAHADVQHGNVLMVGGSRAGSLAVKLIDYDGMFVPELEARPSGELGHPCFQHPLRAAGKVYSANLDRFPELVVAAAVKGVSVLGPGVWEKYDTGDNLLFTEDDFKRPAASEVMRELWDAGEPGLRSLVGHLALSCKRPMVQTPWLDELAPDGVARPLTAAEERAAAEVLGVPPPPRVVDARPLPPPPPVWVVDAWPVLPQPVVVDAAPVPPVLSVMAEIVEETRERPKKGTSRKKGKAAGSKRPLAIVAGVVLAVGAVVGGLIAFGGKKPEKTTPDTEVAKAVEKPVPRPVDPAAQKTFTDPAPKDPNPLEPRKSTSPLVNPKPGDGPPDRGSTAELQAEWTIELPIFGNGTWTTTDADTRYVVAAWNEAGEPITHFRGYDAKTGAPNKDFRSPRLESVNSPLPLGGGRVAFLGGKSTRDLFVWDIDKNRADAPLMPDVSPPPNSNPIRLASPNGRFILQAATRINSPKPPPGAFRLTDTVTRQEVLSMDWGSGRAMFTPDSSRLLVFDPSGEFRWYDLPSARRVGGWSIGAEPTDRPGTLVGLSADGGTVLFRGQPAGLPESHYLLDGATGAVVHAFSPKSYLLGDSAALSRDGQRVALYRFAGFGVSYVELLTRTGERLGQARTPGGAAWLSFSADGTALFARLGSRVSRFTVPGGGSDVAAAPPKKADPPVMAAKDPPKKDVPVATVQPVPLAPKPAESIGVPPDGPAPELQAEWSVEVGGIRWGTVSASGDMRYLVVVGDAPGGKETIVRSYDAKTGTPGPVLRRGPEGQNLRPFPLGGARVGLRDARLGRELLVWDIDKEKTEPLPLPELSSPHSMNPVVLASPDGRYTLQAVSRINPPTPPPPSDFRVLNAGTGKPILATEWKTGGAMFAADSSRLLVFDSSTTFRWYDMPSGRPTGGWTYGLEPAAVPGTLDGMSADGGTLLFYGKPSGLPDSFYLLDGKTGAVVRAFPRNQYTGNGALSRDGEFVALLRNDGFGTGHTLEVRNRSGKLVGKTQALGGAYSLSFAADGTALFAHIGGRVSRFTIPATARGIAVPPAAAPNPKGAGDGAAAPKGDGSLQPVWAVKTRTNAAEIEADPANRLVFLFGHTHSDSPTVLNTRTGAAAGGFAGMTATTLFLTADNRLVTHMTNAAECQVWNPRTGVLVPGKRLVPAFTQNNPNSGVAVFVSPDGKFTVACRNSYFRAREGELPLVVLDTTTGKKLVETTWAAGSVHFTADSSRVLVAEFSGRCRWFKLPSGEAGGGWEFADSGPLAAHSFYGMSDDGAVIGYGGPGGDGVATGTHFLDGATGKSRRALPRETYSSESPVQVSADGRRAAVLRNGGPNDGGRRSTVDILDVGTGEVLAKASKAGPTNGIPSYRMTRDGRCLFIHEGDTGTFQMFDLPPSGK